MRSHLVFMCPRCRRFLTAPVGQKRRMCSYCGKIIDISREATALFDSAEAAAEAVRRFNAGKSGDFEEAVRRSRERIEHLLPKDEIDAARVARMSDGRGLPSGKMQRLLLMFRDLATKRPCPLSEIEQACPRYGLEWTWVEKQIEKMFSRGELFAPRPWTIRYIGEAPQKHARTNRDVSDDILQLIREQGGEMLTSEIVAIMTAKGVTEDATVRSLDRLMNDGVVYEPVKGTVRLVQ